MLRLPGRLVLIGHPVHHSLSPAFQNAALQRAGIPLVYEAEDVPDDRLESTVALLRSQDAAGNVTIPHKNAFAVLCSRLTPVAQRVGAVNTFWMEEGQLVGDNTDVGGFDAAARTLMGGQPVRSRVALIGAGGAAAAVVAAVERWDGARVCIWSRTQAASESLAARFPSVARVASNPTELLSHAHLVVNATPIGLHTDEMPFEPEQLPRDAAVLDLVYRREQTPWVRACYARGMRARDGLHMLIEQGALAFERWFGVAPDRNAMWSAVR